MHNRYLIIGLGNPGRRYANNRHNLGFMIADLLASEVASEFQKKSCQALIAVAMHQDQDVIIAKPQLYMNRSGEAVQQLVRYFNIDVDKILVVVDDADLPLGKLRLRKQGSAGGHNGLKSIIAHLNTQEFARLRVGMGRPNGENDMVEHVLSDFSRAETAVVRDVCQQAVQTILGFITLGTDQTTNTTNTL